MWEIFSSFHSRESGNLPVFAAFGGEFAPLALESGDSRFRGNGDGGGMGGMIKMGD